MQIQNKKIVCIFYTFAYNAENTIARTIESVLAQTYSHWVYYVLNNGSTDNTGKIIQDYADRDSRIIPLTNKLNHVWEAKNHWQEVAGNYNEDDYFCFLDADDEYKPDFIEKMLEFVKENKLEIAACGSDFIDAETNELLKIRHLKKDLLLESSEFSEYFVLYHKYMRTMWGKLYTLPIIRDIDTSKIPSVAYGWDTLFVIENFLNVSRIGINSESLHKYYVSEKSLSYKHDYTRIESDTLLHEKSVDYLLRKCGEISYVNQDFLMIVYMSAIISTLKVIMRAKISVVEKVSDIIKVFSNKYTKQLAAQENFGISTGNPEEKTQERNKFFSEFANFFIYIENISNELPEDYCDIGEFLCAASDNTAGWLFFNKKRIEMLINKNHIQEANQKLSEMEALIPEDADIIVFRKILQSVQV